MPRLTHTEIRKAYAEGGECHPQADETHETNPSSERSRQIADWYEEYATETTARLQELNQRLLMAIAQDDQYEISRARYELGMESLTAIITEDVLNAMKEDPDLSKMDAIRNQLNELNAMNHPID